MISHFVLLLLLHLSLHCNCESEVSGNEQDRCNQTVELFQTVSTPLVTEANRGLPLHCSYRIRIRPAKDDWMANIRFVRFKVGQPSPDRRSCIGGYVQIVDGYRDSNYSNKDHAGFFCGEIDMPKMFISETPFVKIILHVDSFDADTFLQFDTSVKQPSEIPERFGQFHVLYPNRRGKPIPGHYCQRSYTDCSHGRCFVQSPGFPGIYLRNLRCRYHLSARQSLVGLELSAFDVDGQSCDNLLMCFPRPVTSKQNQCPFDFVRIYDGPDESSPVIATLCGRGRFKSNVISSTNQMLVEFVTASAGPLLSTGFHFKAAAIDSGDMKTIQIRNGSCVIERQLSDPNAPEAFASIRSWYPSNTSCIYRFVSARPKHSILLEFASFRVERVTLCQENVRIFDGAEPEASTLMTKLCDTNKPQVGLTRTTFVSSGSSMTVQFFSSIGSFDGSSLNYVFDVRLILAPNGTDKSFHVFEVDNNKNNNNQTANSTLDEEVDLNTISIATVA